MNSVEGNRTKIMVQNVLVNVSDTTGLEFLVKKLLLANSGIIFYCFSNNYQIIFDILGKDSAGSHLIKMPSETGLQEAKSPLTKKNKTVCFDLVVANLNPFASGIEKTEYTLEKACSSIDTVGPEMIRDTAANFHYCVILCNPEDYALFCEEVILNKGHSSLFTRSELMGRAISHTTEYYMAISEYLANMGNEQPLELHPSS